MIRKQRINIGYAPEQFNSVSRLLEQVGEKLEFGKVNFLFFKEGDERLNELLKLLDENKFEYFLMEFREYTKEEIDNAPLLQVRLDSHCGGGSLEFPNKFDESELCKYCGYGGRKLIPPLIMNVIKMGKKDISNTYQFETIISERLAKILESNKVTGYKLEEVRHYSDKLKNPPRYYQLIVTNTFPPLVSPTRFKKENYCEHCGKAGLYLDSELYYSRKELTSWQDFNQTREVFGYKAAKPVITISQRLYRIFKANKIKHIKVEPIHFIE